MKGSFRTLPGFGLTLGYTVFYISILLLFPLSALFMKSLLAGPDEILQVLLDARTQAAFRLSFAASFLAALSNALFGLLTAYVLVRYDFPLKKLLDAVVDIPFAIPTAVSGIALVAIFSESGILGSFFYSIGIETAYSSTGIVIALMFTGLPFVVRTVQPVIEGLDIAEEEAGLSLGASRLNVFFRIILPRLIPAVMIGFSLAFARGLGEYGSIVFISGNLPYQTEIVPLLIFSRLEQFDYTAAAILGSAMVVVSFFCLLLVNILQRWSYQR